MTRKLEELTRLEVAKRGILVGLAWGMALGLPVGIILQKLYGT